MKKSVLLFTATLNLFAGDPWLGHWKPVSAKLRLEPAPQVIITPRPNGLVLAHNAGNNSFTWSADFDGRDYPVSGNSASLADYISLRRVGTTAFEVMSKKAGKTIMGSVYTVSADGREISVSHTYPDRNGKNEYVFERAGGAVSEASPLAGTWAMNYDKAQLHSQYTVKYEPDGKDGVRCTFSTSGTAWAGQFDGKEYPVTTNYHEWTSITLHRIDERSFELTGKRANTDPEIWRIVVSKDNRELTIDGQGAWTSGARLSSHLVYQRQ